MNSTELEERIEELELSLLQALWALEDAVIDLRNQLKDLEIKAKPTKVWADPKN